MIGLEQKIDAKWKDFSQKLPHKRSVAYTYNLVAAFWFLEDQEKVLKWLANYTEIKKKAGKIRDLNNSLSLLYLPILYDYENSKGFPAMYNDIDNIRRVLLDQNNQTEYSQIVIKYFKQLNQKKPGSKENIILSSFLLDLDKLNSSVDTLGLLEIKCWIKSKLENKPKRKFLIN